MIAAGKLLPPGKRNGRTGETIAVAVSAVLHAAAIAILLLRPGRALPPPVPPLEVEMIQQSAEVRGAPPPPEAAPALAKPPTPAAPPSPDAPKLPPKPQAPAPSAPAPPTPPTAQSPQPTPTQRAAPEVNLGNAAQDFDPLIVTGENVVPPRPDARYRNLPPHYPAAAAKIGAEGTVQLVARVAPNGLPLSVGVIESSGNVDLDEEARRAVSLWHFNPARDGRRAVPYDYVVRIHFSMDNRQAQPSEE